MIAKSILVGMAVVLSLGAGPARAGVCLGKSMTLDETADATAPCPDATAR
jgi:hypothetical protein